MQATKKASDRLKELNMMAAQALTAKITTTNNNTNHTTQYYGYMDTPDIYDHNQNHHYRHCSNENDFLFDHETFKNEFKRPNTRSLITRRHTIQSMTKRTSSPPILMMHHRSFKQQEETNYDIHYAKHITLDNQLVSPLLKTPSPKYTTTTNTNTSTKSPTSPYCHDTKAYVGSFNQAQQLPCTHHLLLPSHRKLSLNITNEFRNSTPPFLDKTTDLKQVNNNFNNDFYRLCSGETFFFDNETSENNLNYLSQQTVTTPRNMENSNGNNLATTSSNLTNHVNTLFDQWLSNSANSSPCKKVTISSNSFTTKVNQ